MTPTTESESGRRRLLWFSVGLNLVLLVVLAVFRPAASSEPLSVPAMEAAEEASAPASAMRSGPPRSQRYPIDLAAREPTPWSRLVSADLREYAHNLRLAGCPAETICDILRPEGKRRLESRVATARGQTNFWLAGSRLAAHRREVQALERGWRQDQADLLTELGCVADWPEEEDFRIDLIAWVAAGHLRPEQQRELLNLLASAIQIHEQWREWTGGVVLPSDLQWLAAERERFRQLRQQTVSAADFEEVCLRLSALLEFIAVPDETAAAVGLTPAEFRELHRRGFLAGENELERTFSLARVMNPEPRPSRSESQLEADQREVLGDARAEELQLRASNSYAVTQDWTKKFGLEASASRVVFAELREFRRTVATLAATGRDRPEAVKADFLAAQTATMARLEETLSRVPATNRVNQLRSWLAREARVGWRRP